MTKCLVANPVELMCRYLDGKDDLSPDEKEILMFALYCESKDREGSLVQLAIRKLGVWVQPRAPSTPPPREREAGTLTQEMLRASYDAALKADHQQHPSLFQYMADYLNAEQTAPR